jgi:hypothetical protein
MSEPLGAFVLAVSVVLVVTGFYLIFGTIADSRRLTGDADLLLWFRWFLIVGIISLILGLSGVFYILGCC